MKSSLIHKIGFYTVIGLVLIFPIFFLPITSEFYDFNKQFLLISVSAILLVVLSLSFIADKQVKLTTSPFSLPLLALVASFIISTIARTPNRMDTLLDPGQTGSIVALSLYFFTAVSFIKSKKELDLLVTTTIASFSILAMVTILWGSGLISKVLPVAFLQNPLWNPTGSALTTLILMVILLPFLGIIIAKQKDNSTKVLTLSVALFLCVIAAGLVSYRIFRTANQQPIFLSQSTAWSIALESLKSSPILGTGPDTYFMDFTRFKPLSYNQTPNWSIRFSGANNYYLQLLTTGGLLGLATLLFLSYHIVSLLIHTLKSTSESVTHTPALAATITAVLVLVSFFFTSPTLVTFFLLFTLLVISVAAFKLMGSPLVHEANIDIIAASDGGIRTPILPWVTLILSAALIIPFAIPLAHAYYAETLFQNAIVAAGAKDGKTTYNDLNAAIKQNPLRDTYRIAASQTNLMLANSASAKDKLTTDDRNVITQLVQQSIQEGKNAIALNPTKVTNVENLASIYQNLLNLAQGADQWAIVSYRQAITLDPTYPTLRISLGGVYYALKNYPEALNSFQQAADLKPDFANAYYNLASVYKDQKDYQNAYTAMQTVVNLVDKSSADYTTAKGELDQLAKLIPAKETTQTPTAPAQTELTKPQTMPTPKVNPPLPLPTSLGPQTTPAPSMSPIPSISTTPAPSTSPSPSVSPTP